MGHCPGPGRTASRWRHAGASAKRCPVAEHASERVRTRWRPARGPPAAPPGAPGARRPAPRPPAVPTVCVASAPLDRRPEDFAPSLRLLRAGFTEGQVRDTWLPWVSPSPRRSGPSPTLPARPAVAPCTPAAPPPPGCRSGRARRCPLWWASSGHISRGEAAGSQSGRGPSAGAGPAQQEGGWGPFPLPLAGDPLRPAPAEEVLCSLQPPPGCRAPWGVSGPFWEEGAGPGCRSSQLPGEPSVEGVLVRGGALPGSTGHGGPASYLLALLQLSEHDDE